MFDTAWRRLVCTVATLGVLVSAWTSAGLAEDAPKAGADGRIEEIVVRARKRDELLKDTPVSVTALSSDDLRINSVNRLDDIQQVVPNLSFYSGRSGVTAAVFIRGVGQVDPVVTFDPGVGIYVDGVFMARQAGGVLNMVDIEQVEVLRGPQGTLFGKNTVGGAILVKTVRPREEFGGEVSIGAGSFDAVRTRVTLNAPVELGALGDRLFTRLTFAQEYSEGYTRNTLLDRNRNDINSLGFLGALRFVATDDLELNLTGNWFRDQTNGKGGRCAVANDPAPLDGLVDSRLADECRRSSVHRFENNAPGRSDIETYGVWGDLTWEVGRLGLIDDLSVKSISSWREQRLEIREDGDGTRLPELQLSEVEGGGDFDGEPGFQRQFSQEVHANVDALDGAIQIVAGAFGFWEEAKALQSIYSFPELVRSIPTLGATTDGRIKIDNSSWALFGQATYSPLDWLSLSAGLRYTEEKKGFRRIRTIPAVLFPGIDAFDVRTDDCGVAKDCLIDADKRKVFQAWTPMGNISLDAPEELIGAVGLDHLLTYFTYSEGFKSGGFNGNSLSEMPGVLDPFDQETLQSFELGVKLMALDRRVSVNAAVFRSNYDDIQVAVIDSGASVLAEIRVENAAEATVEGAEIEVDVRPVAGLAIRGSVGFLDTEFKEFKNAPSATADELLDRSGESFNNVPDLESQVSISYTMDTPDILDFGWDRLRGTITPILQHSYRSEVHYQGPELREATQHGYNLLNARLVYLFNDDRSEISAWGRNLTDENYFQQNFPTANTVGVVVQYYEAPQSFGVELSHRF